MSYTLTSYEPQIGCYGTSYASMADAKNYAMEMQKLGLCLKYTIGKYEKDGHCAVYDSHRKVENGIIQY